MAELDYVSLAQELSMKLDKFEWVEFGQRAKFRCPICGDSKKDPNKARGGFIKNGDSLLMHCFNCGTSMSMLNFAKTVDYSTYREFLFNSFKNEKGKQHSGFNAKRVEKPVHVSVVDSLKRVVELDRDHEALKYLLDERRLPKSRIADLRWVENFNSFAKQYTNSITSDAGKPAIVFPLITDSGIEYGFQARYLTGNLRYKTVMIDKRFRKCYGQHLLSTDSSMGIHVTEGGFDSMFLVNGIASLDSDLASTCDALHYDKNRFVLHYDNEPNNEQIMNLKSKAIDKGYRVAFIDPSIAKFGKDYNEIMLSCYTKDTLDKIRNPVIASGIRAKLLHINR